jgi:hypothetical protein
MRATTIMVTPRNADGLETTRTGGFCAVCGVVSYRRCRVCSRTHYCGEEHSRVDAAAHARVCGDGDGFGAGQPRAVTLTGAVEEKEDLVSLLFSPTAASAGSRSPERRDRSPHTSPPHSSAKLIGSPEIDKESTSRSATFVAALVRRHTHSALVMSKFRRRLGVPSVPPPSKNREVVILPCLCLGVSLSISVCVCL